MSKYQMMKQIEDSVKNCKKCDLYKTRKKIVFGEGLINTDVFFIGEAPGKKEDQQGKPFVGRAGKLLDELLDSIGLKRGEIFISNIIKCRPPKNRNPLRSEIKACKYYLEKQIEIIKPKIIIPLGNFASSFVFDKYDLKKSKISNISGKVFRQKNIDLIPIYHPAAAIYDPNKKSVLLNDFKVIKKQLKKIK